MHELSLAEHLFELVLQQAKLNQARQVSQITLEIGTLAAVENSALCTAFACLAQGSLLQSTELIIETVCARGICSACGVEQDMFGQYMECAVCHLGYLTAVSGTEMRIKQILIEK